MAIDLKCLYDAVVVGTGLAGGWALKELSEGGAHVIALDAGPQVTPYEVAGDRAVGGQRYEVPRRQMVQSRHPSYWTANPKLFVDDIDNPYRSDSDFLWIRGRQVGGRSVTWGGVALRFSDFEFLAPNHDGVGTEWPLSYSDLAPYYSRVERFLGVEGSYENLPQLPDGEFTTTSGLTETELRFKDIVERKWEARKVISCRGVPKNCNHLAAAGLQWSPRTSQGSTISAALATGRAAIRSDSIVSRLIMSDRSVVRGVACIDRVTKEEFEVRGRVVVLAASTIETVRILLNSGIANSSGVLGTGLCDHMAVSLGGTIPNSKHLPFHPSGGANNICIPKFRNIDEKRSDFIRGYGVWGGMQRKATERHQDAAWFLTSVLEVLPKVESRISLDPQMCDAWGVPVIRVHLAYGENERRMKDDAICTMLEMASACDLDVRGLDVTYPGQYVHELGGARMGRSPETSVVNAFNQCWDVQNVFVVDGSCFATAGWQNPSLTIMALAARACTYMQEYLRTGGVSR